jgi:hypothetical protein
MRVSHVFFPSSETEAQLFNFLRLVKSSHMTLKNAHWRPTDTLPYPTEANLLAARLWADDECKALRQLLASPLVKIQLSGNSATQVAAEGHVKFFVGGAEDDSNSRYAMVTRLNDGTQPACLPTSTPKVVGLHVPALRKGMHLSVVADMYVTLKRDICFAYIRTPPLQHIFSSQVSLNAAGS